MVPCIQKFQNHLFRRDYTGHIELVLWREQADGTDFKEGNVLSLQNLVVSTFNYQLSITSPFETVITTQDEEMTVTCTHHPMSSLYRPSMLLSNNYLHIHLY